MAFFKRIKNALSEWPEDLPRYYPDESASELAEFMSEEEFRRIQNFDVAYILPFAREDSEAAEVALGIGLSHQIIRNLMLLNDISIRGPEDTPQVPRESVPEVSQTSDVLWVTGTVSVAESACQLEYEVWQDGEMVSGNVVKDASFSSFLLACTRQISLSLGSLGRCTIENAWETGQPDSPNPLLQYGLLVLSHPREDTIKRTHAAIKLLQMESSIGLVAWQLSSDLPVCRKWLLKGIELDPHNPHLYFEAFSCIWNGRGAQPWAVQLCRKAIELSPGLGKAHMCLPHATQDSADVLNHSELGYRLLKGNPFAINNYILNLRLRGNPTDEQVMDLAKEGIACDPENPSNYDQLIDLFTSMEDYRQALEVAKRKLALFHPEMNPRALYSLRQAPQIRKAMDAGKYDPVRDAMNLVANLQKRI